MPKLEDLELKVKQTTANTQGLKGMASALAELGKVSGSLGKVPQSVRAVSEALRHLPVESANAIKGIATALVTLKNTAQYSSTIASSVRQVSKALNELTASIDAEKLSAIANAMAQIKDASKSARVNTALKAVKAQQATTNTTDGETAASDSTNQELGEVADAAWRKVENFREANRRYLNSIKDSTKGTSKFVDGRAHV